MNIESNKTYNGRVDIESPNMSIRFAMMDRIPVNDSTSFRDALTGNLTDTPLSQAFFSSKNIQIIQNGIRAEVYKKSNGLFLIGPQDYDVIKTIMRGFYLQNSINLQSNYTQQIIALNKLVIDYSVHQVLGEAEGYMKYKRDVSTMYMPMNLPSLETTKNKTLELKNWF